MISPLASMPLGVVVRKSPGVTRWAAWSWKAIAVLPGAPEANWRELRREGEVVEYHAGTLPLNLYPGEAEAYLAALSVAQPSVYAVLRPDPTALEAPLKLHLVTASPYEAEDYLDSGDEMVEKIPMPPGLVDWLRAFVADHYEAEAFVKRRRNKARVDLTQDGKGDARVSQLSDVYRAPRRKGPLQ